MATEFRFLSPWSAASEQVGLVSAGPLGMPAVFVCKFSPCSAIAGILVIHYPGLSQLLTAAAASVRAGWGGNK